MPAQHTNRQAASASIARSTVTDRYSGEESSNYVDQSDVIISGYKNSSTNGLERYFLEIEDWLDSDQQENLPYMIEAEQGVGKKTLLVKWMDYHQTMKKKEYPDVILPHFASAGGSSCNYFFAIYRILNRLREVLDIEQKVELREDKLRRYFEFWLQHCSDKLDKELKFGEKVNYDKVILIIEGIDLFPDHQFDKEASSAFWLPRVLPKHIRLIVTCDKSSEANGYFKSLQCQVLKIPVELGVVHMMVDRHAKRQLFIDEATTKKHLDVLLDVDEGCKNSSFYKIYLCMLLPYPVVGVIGPDEISEGSLERIYQFLDYEKLKRVGTFTDLIEFLIGFYSNHLMPNERFFKLLRVFALMQKGLTLEEIKYITQVTDIQWKMFLACFKVFILGYKGLWILNNDAMKHVILDRFKFDESQVRDLHREIAFAIESVTANSVRKLEEQTYHLYMSRDLKELKETLSAIENFLFLFTPNNKYDFCRYWKILEGEGFDPVMEYNKAIEGFEMHYRPSSEDVFRIIVQISRFLKEFSDFETSTTPGFRHPPVKGTYEELDDIGILRELISLKIFQPIEAEENETPDLDKVSRDLNEKIEKSKVKVKQRTKKESTLKRKRKKLSSSSNINDYENDGNRKQYITRSQQLIDKEIKHEQWKEKKLARNKQQILSQIESLNVDIPSNREQFRQYYENFLREIIRTNRQQQQMEEDNIFDDIGKEDDEDDDELSEQEEHKSCFVRGMRSRRKRRQQRSNKTTKEVITMEQLREIDEQQERQPTFYHYKRWLWVQFPWVCLSIKCDYSAKLKECYSSPIEYMSVKKEREFTMQALKIAIEAKIKKQMAYKKQTISDSQSTIKHTSVGQSAFTRTSLQNLPSLTVKQNPTNQQHTLKNNRRQYNRSVSYSSSEQQQNQLYTTTDRYLNQTTLSRVLKAERKKKNSDSSAVENHENNTNNDNNDCESQTSAIGTGHSTSRILEKGRARKEKSRNFDPIQNMQDSENIVSVLPRLKGQIVNHSKQGVYVLESLAIHMKRELDSLIDANRKLARQLKDIRITEVNQSKYGGDPQKIERAIQKVSELEKSISETEESHLNGQIQADRYASILKICEENKQNNEEWIRSLNYLLSNFKKMIRMEKEDIRQARKECVQLQRINREYVKAMMDKFDTQRMLINQISRTIRSKEKFDYQFQNTDSVIEQSASLQIERIRAYQRGKDERRRQKEIQVEIENYGKRMQEELAQMQMQYEKLKPVLDASDPEFVYSEKFQRFQAAREKRDELACKLLEKQDVITSLKDKLIERRVFLKTVKKAYPEVDSIQVDDSNEQSEERLQEVLVEQQQTENQEILSEIQRLESELNSKQAVCAKREQVHLAALMAVIMLQKKLGIEETIDVKRIVEFDEQKMIENLNERMSVIKERVDPVDYEQFLAGQFEIAKVYRNLVKNVGQPDYEEANDNSY